MRKLIVLIAVVLYCQRTDAATVDTISIYSHAMHKDFKCVVIKPVMNQDETLPLPVVYLLHGYSGWYSNWIIRVPELKSYADQYGIMIVCPDGGYSSWYFDSPVDSSMKYETYIGKEVPEYIDAHYPTIKNRTGRAITGLSMGGHGALFLAFRHSEFFGACGSMSGGVDLNYSRNKFDIIKRIGDTINYADNWKKYIVMTVAENYAKELTGKKADTLAITFDCGTGDFYYEPNHKLHDELLVLKIQHDYTERPGVHDWAYWRNSIQYHLLFFKNYFDNPKRIKK